MTDEILEQLKDDDKKFLEEVKTKITDNKDKLDSICNFVMQRVGHENVSDLAELSLEEKIQTCLDHMAISLLAGDLKKAEIENLL